MKYSLSIFPFKIRFKIRILAFLLIFFWNGISIFPETKLENEESPRPTSILKGTTEAGIDPESIFKTFENHDILIFGEEHDDIVGHKIRLDWFKKIALKTPVILSLEMLERDQQKTLDEYLNGRIGEKAFFNALKLWPNYLRDYHPFVQFAKERGIPVLASNVPKKYANLVSSSGLEALFKIRSVFLPPKYLVRKFSQENYETKIKNILKAHPGMDFDANTERKFVDAQYLWDAGMADSIADTFLTKGRKVIHISGRFHSDEGFGVVHRLRELGFKILSISMFPLKEGDVVPTEILQGCDFTVITERRQKEN
ncbi:PF04187 family protein [Leptospira weilii serovar Ranarum str. ICFT]|uniref:PF04187 family protein n=1 Tax=Leptospira weilii serovar Ranarum str. ICFT TaxID=1218598 RepID=N1WJY3_9LEPT|nr:PF04187 family protein [Leptospira weilii serovar Ranarum str. ICFT]